MSYYSENSASAASIDTGTADSALGPDGSFSSKRSSLDRRSQCSSQFDDLLEDKGKKKALNLPIISLPRFVKFLVF